MGVRFLKGWFSLNPLLKVKLIQDHLSGPFPCCYLWSPSFVPLMSIWTAKHASWIHDQRSEFADWSQLHSTHQETLIRRIALLGQPRGLVRRVTKGEQVFGMGIICFWAHAATYGLSNPLQNYQAGWRKGLFLPVSESTTFWQHPSISISV